MICSSLNRLFFFCFCCCLLASELQECHVTFPASGQSTAERVQFSTTAYRTSLQWKCGARRTRLSEDFLIVDASKPGDVSHYDAEPVHANTNYI